jgi:hypothetical protein
MAILKVEPNSINSSGDFTLGNVTPYSVYTDYYFYANGAVYGGGTASSGAAGATGPAGDTGYTGSRGIQGTTGTTGYTGSSGTNGYTGSQGDTGLGFTVAKSYASVAALTADTSPTGIVTGQFAIVETGNTNNAENSRLYLWNGSVYSYVSDLSGSQGITGPAGAIGYTGSAGTSGTNGYTGSSGSGGSGGVSYNTGDVVLSANASVYSLPTWIQAQGQMFDTGTYPGLDTLYSTSGSYDGIATQISQAVTSGTSNPISFTTTVSHNQGVHDPVTGDYYYFDGANKMLVIGRDSSGNYIQSANSLMSTVNGNINAGTIIRFNISPDGMVFAIHQGASLYVFKRNTSGVESSTGVRFVLLSSIIAPNWLGASTLGTNYPVNLDVTNTYWVCVQATGYQAFVQANLNTNTLDNIQSYVFGSNNSANGPYNAIGQLQAVNPFNQSMLMNINDTTTTPNARLWTLSGTTWSNVAKTLSSATRWNKILWSLDGAAIYLGKLGASNIEIYSHDGSGNIALVGSIAGTNVAAMNNMAMSAGGTYIACGYSVSPHILLFKRDAVGGYTYTQTSSGPQNASQITGVQDIFFDPVYNILGATSTASPYAPRFWIGATKTILPNLGIPGKNLKYYIKTGS